MTANADIFAKIGDIKGESTDDKHKDQISVLSWSWGVTGPQRKTPACPHEFTINKFVDAATPFLVSAAAQGATFPEAVIAINKPGKDPTDYLVWTFKGVVIAGITSAGGSNTAAVSESLSFNYASATIAYRMQQPDGSYGTAVTATVGPSCPSP